MYQKVSVPTESVIYTTNHLLFIDDLKLLAESESELQRMMKETKEFFKTVGLEMNRRDKSATNTEACSEDAVLLDDHKSYKYLGITETASSTISIESFEKVK